MKKWFLLLALPIPSLAFAQSYSIDWYKISGGGGTSTGATYQVTGTIGQPEAGGAMSGGQYSVTGGFWSLIAVVQTAGLPNLSIAHSGNSVIVSWPNTASCTLQTNNNLASAVGLGCLRRPGEHRQRHQQRHPQPADGKSVLSAV